MSFDLTWIYINYNEQWEDVHNFKLYHNRIKQPHNAQSASERKKIAENEQARRWWGALRGRWKMCTIHQREEKHTRITWKCLRSQIDLWSSWAAISWRCGAKTGKMNEDEDNDFLIFFHLPNTQRKERRREAAKGKFSYRRIIGIRGRINLSWSFERDVDPLRLFFSSSLLSSWAFFSPPCVSSGTLEEFSHGFESRESRTSLLIIISTVS